MTGLLRREPALTGALAALLAAVLGVFIKNPELVAALVGVALAFIGVRQVVTPVATMVENVTAAATGAATQVAQDLGETTVGAVGEVTDAAQNVVDNAVNSVLGALGVRQ